MKTKQAKPHHSRLSLILAFCLSLSGGHAIAADSSPYNNNYYGPDYSPQFTNMQDQLANIFGENQSMTGSLKTMTGSLQEISQNVWNILEKVDKLPAAINSLIDLTTSWLAFSDGSDGSNSIIATAQQDFAKLGNDFSTSSTAQIGLQRDLLAAQFGVSPLNFDKPQDDPDGMAEILKELPQVNNLSFASVLGSPPVSSAPYSTNEFVKNAAGLTVPHQKPKAEWSGSGAAKRYYKGFYNTISAVQSQTTYVLSRMIVNHETNNERTTLQNQLITQASSSSWILEIGTKELGKILRDILLFTSQSYVLLSQQVKLQEELLTTAAMTNAILIATSIPVETELAHRASTKT